MTEGSSVTERVDAALTIIRRALSPGVLALFQLAVPVPTDFTKCKVTEYGELDNGSINRDSLVSVQWYDDKVFWLARDSQPINDGVPGFPIIVNTASYSTKPDPTRAATLGLGSPQGFGQVYLPLASNQQPPFGIGDDDTRWVGWPDTAPTVTFAYDKTVSAYAFVSKVHLRGLTPLNDPPAYALYHLLDHSAGKEMPVATLEKDDFWASGEIGYGSAASVVRNSYAYLYGATPDSKLAVARCTLNTDYAVLSDRSLYEYYVNGEWTRRTPKRDAPGISLVNTRSAQGTIYYSERWQRYVWIGGDSFPTANAYISLSSAPEGSWSEPIKFYEGRVGTGPLPAYSLVAHPGLTDGTGNYIFLTWTITVPAAGNQTRYAHPMVRIDWS